MSTTASSDVSELFDGPSRWREAAIDELGLEGEDRCAGASTSPAMPRLIGEFADRLARSPAGPAVDVGGGLGPASAWLSDVTSHGFITIDPSATECAGAQRLFGIPALQAIASALPFATGSCSSALLNGVVSLLDELAPTIAEAVRVTRGGGLVAVADLTSADDRRVITDTNTFWTVDDIVAALTDAGCSVEHYACCDPTAGPWSDVQSEVHDEIAERAAGRRGFDAWLRDGEQIARLVDAERIAAASIIARTPS